MRNPGLKDYTPDEPFLRVISRTTANQIMRQPQTYNGDGASGVVPPEPPTLRENMLQGPPSASSNTPGPNATNGAPPILRLNDVASTPGMETEPEKQARITRQQTDGANDNQKYRDAQLDIQRKMQERRAHPLHQLTAETDEEFWARQPDVVDRDPRINEGPGCETCWLTEGDPNAHEGLHVGDFGGGHQFVPFEGAPSKRFSAYATAPSNPGMKLTAESALDYDPDDPLAAPPGGGSGSRRPRTEDYGLGDDGWHRFGLMHPEGHDDNQNITIAVKHHGDVPSPWGDKNNTRPQFEVRVGKGESQVMPSNGGGYPYWGSALKSGFHTSHRDVAQGVASALGSDAQDIDLPLHQRSMYDDHDRPMTEENYPWAMGEGQHEWPVLGDGGGSVPYSDSEKEFLREHADRLAKAGIEDYELNQTGEPSTLVNLDHHEGGGPAPETKPHPRYGAAEWSNILREG